MCDIGDCTAVEVDSLDAFDFEEQFEEAFASFQTANKTDSFRAVIELSMINTISATKGNDRLTRVAFSGKMELTGSVKAWKELDQLDQTEESMDTDESSYEEFSMLDSLQEGVAEIAHISKGTISTQIKLQASGYDANNHFLGSRTWVTLPSQNKQKSA